MSNQINTPDWRTFATIKPEAERAAWWLETFGGYRCPVKSIIAHRANLPGHPDALVYEMDIAALAPEMRERLVASIAKRFGQDPAFVEASLDDIGCPILAEDVVVTTTNVGPLLIDDFPERESGPNVGEWTTLDDAWGWRSAGLSALQDEEEEEDLPPDAPGSGIVWTDFEAGLNASGWPDGDEDDDLFTGGDWDGDEDDWEDEELWEADEAREYAEEEDEEL